MITVNNIPKNNQGIIKFPNKEIKFQILLMAKHSNVCVCLPNPILSEDKMFVCQSFTHKRKEKKRKESYERVLVGQQTILL